MTSGLYFGVPVLQVLGDTEYPTEFNTEHYTEYHE